MFTDESTRRESTLSRWYSDRRYWYEVIDETDMKAIEKESEYAFDPEKLTSYYDCQSHDTSKAEKFRYNVVDVRCNSRDVIFRKKRERKLKESEHAFDSVSHMTH